MSTDTMILSIDGRTADNPEVLEGWDAQAYSLSGSARGAGSEAAMADVTRLDVAPDAVLELELDNGARILVAAEDAERYLGAAVGRGAGKLGEIQVGATLRFAGVRPPSGVARDGLGAWLLKGLRVPVVGIQIHKIDPAEIFCFEPMNHGRHGAAGTSGESEEFHELQLPGSEVDRAWVGGVQVRTARGGNRKRCRSGSLGGWFHRRRFTLRRRCCTRLHRGNRCGRLGRGIGHCRRGARSQ